MTSFKIKSFRPQHNYRLAVARPKKHHWLWRGVFLLTILILFFILFTYVLPSARVTIVTETENISQDFEIQLTTDNTKVNEENNIFAAVIVATEETKESEFKATGSKNMGKSATGQAIFFNKTGNPQPITPDMDLVSDQGSVFKVAEPVNVPGARVDDQGQVVSGEIIVAISSKEAGAKANNISGRVNISALALDRQEKIYGSIQNTTSGGTDKNETVVSQEDLDQAKAKLLKDLETPVKESLNKKAGAEMIISDQLIQFDSSETNTSVAIDNPADNFKMALKLKAQAFAYDNKNLRQNLKTKIAQKLKPGQTIAETEFGSLELTVQDVDFSFGTVKLAVKATFPVAENIDLKTIKANILGKSEVEARRYILSLPKVKDVRFDFSMSLNSKLPEKEDKIIIELGQGI